MDWSVLEKVGVAGVALAILYFGFNGFKLVLEQWKNSTDAVDKNTKAFMSLSAVFEKQVERELEFQREITTLLKSGVATAEDTNRKVTEIHSHTMKRRKDDILEGETTQ